MKNKLTFTTATIILTSALTLAGCSSTPDTEPAEVDVITSETVEEVTVAPNDEVFEVPVGDFEIKHEGDQILNDLGILGHVQGWEEKINGIEDVEMYYTYEKKSTNGDLLHKNVSSAWDTLLLTAPDFGLTTSDRSMHDGAMLSFIAENPEYTVDLSYLPEVSFDGQRTDPAGIITVIVRYEDAQ